MNEYKVGDEVKMGPRLGVITRISDSLVYILCGMGGTLSFAIKAFEQYAVKTGRTYPQITEILNSLEETR